MSKYIYYLNKLKQGVLSDENLKDWVTNEPQIKQVLIDQGLLTEERYKQIFHKTTEQHWSSFNNDEYSDEMIKQLMIHDELDTEQGTQMLDAYYLNQYLKDPDYLNEIRGINIPIDEKRSIVAGIHRYNIRNGKYQMEEIQKLLVSGELGVEDIQKELQPEEFNKMIPCTVEPEFVKWIDLPPLLPNRTDVFMLGVPGSGKSMLMAGMIHYGMFNARLKYELGENKVGAKYLTLLNDVITRGCLVKATAHDRIQYMAGDFVDDDHDVHPLTFIEMNGEVFKEFFQKENIPPILKDYLQSENKKIITLVIDYTVQIKPIELDETPQATLLVWALTLMENQGMLQSTRAIKVIITKWDMCKNCTTEDAKNFLYEHGYSQLKGLFNQFEIKYGISVSFETFSLGEFYGLENKKYSYDKTDSKKIFDWYCDNSAIFNRKKKKPWWKL